MCTWLSQAAGVRACARRVSGLSAKYDAFDAGLNTVEIMYVRKAWRGWLCLGGVVGSPVARKTSPVGGKQATSIAEPSVYEYHCHFKHHQENSVH